MEHDELLGGDLGPPASQANLEGVLRRHLRRRRRLTAGLASAVLALSLGGGAAIGEVLASSGTPAATGAARGTASPAIAPSTGGGVATTVAPDVVPGTSTLGPYVGEKAAAPQGLSWSYSPIAGDVPASTSVAVPSATNGRGGNFDTVGGQSMRRLFERTANGVTARVYRDPSEGELVPVEGPPVAHFPLVCDPYSSLTVEVSDAGAVGEISVPYPQSAPRPVDVVASQVVGTSEGAPMAVLVVRAGSGVQTVQATFASGSVDTAPVSDGVAVLLATLPAGSSGAARSAATVVALDASGGKVEQFRVPAAPALAVPHLCLTMLPGGVVTPPSRTGGSTGSAGSGTGTAAPAAG